MRHRKLLFWLAVPVALLCVGCMTSLSNHGEVGFRYGTEVTFFHRSAETADEPATAELSVPGVTEWIFGQQRDGGDAEDADSDDSGAAGGGD